MDGQTNSACLLLLLRIEELFCDLDTLSSFVVVIRSDFTNFIGLVCRFATKPYLILPKSILPLLVVGLRPISTNGSYSLYIYAVVILLVLLCLVICVINNRRARAAAEQEYNVEANQVDGPPTIIATEYNPTSGPSGIYEGPRSGFSPGQSSAQMTGPTYPVAAQVYSQTRTVTAPVTKTAFPNPPPGYSSVSPLIRVCK